MSIWKKFLKIFVTAVLVAAFALPAIACDRSNSDTGVTEKVDKNRTQLYVTNFNKGFGDDWLYSLKLRFEDFYKDEHFEPGKTGVQVMIDNTDRAGPEFLPMMKSSESAVVFNEVVYYNSYVNAGVVADITDVVRGDLSVYGDEGTIEDKMSEQHKEFYTAKDGKYYGIPHYTSYTGIIYDVDLFEQRNFYLAYNQDNGNNGFIKTKTDRRSLGPDGKTGVIDGVDYSRDDGLPATYEEFFRLCEYIKGAGLVPTIWSGTYRSVYLSYILRSLAVDYEGKDQIMLNYTFDGTAENLVESISADGTVTKRPPVKIDNSNGYELYTSSGRYHAIDFLSRLTFQNGMNSGYWYKNGYEGGLSQIETQKMYLTSVYESDRIAMLFDGIWWENEANDTFLNMSVGDPEMAKTSRRFGFMPMPKATTAEIGEKSTMLDTLYSMCFINKNVEDDPVVFDLAKKFLMFANTQQSLEEFTVITSSPKALNYEISEENQEKMSYFARDVWNLAERSDIVYPISTNPLYLNNQSSFGYGDTFASKVNGTVYTDIGSAIYNFKFTPKQLFDGIAELNSKANWESLYSQYFGD